LVIRRASVALGCCGSSARYLCHEREATTSFFLPAVVNPPLPLSSVLSNGADWYCA